MMLIEANTIEAQLFHQDPGVEMLAVVLHREVWTKMAFGQGIGQFAVHLQVVHVLRIGEQIKTEYLHRYTSCGGQRAPSRWSGAVTVDHTVPTTSRMPLRRATSALPMVGSRSKPHTCIVIP